MTVSDLTAQAASRMAVLASLGAQESTESFTWPTASAVLDRTQGALWIACEVEPAPDDWHAVCTLIALSGFDNGTGGPFPCDPGEPAEIMGLYAWTLVLGATVS